MAEKYEGQIKCDATCDYTGFVKSHRATLDYLLKFGNITEKAKAIILIKLAGGNL